MKCLELFAGIGGFAAAFPDQQIVNAVDIDVHAAMVYRSNFAHPYHIGEIASLPADWFQKQEAEFWWMSPPCTPFTRRGHSAGLSDPRCAALRNLIDVVPQVLPRVVCIENVVGFESSDAYDMLRRQWTRAGYHLEWTWLCPSELGWPNSRPRFYGIASLGERIRINRRFDRLDKRLLSEFLELSLDEEEAESSVYRLSDRHTQQYAKALDIVSPDDPLAIAACFTAAYGKSVIQSGSYLRTEQGLRRFSPREIARLLGFEADFILPSELRTRKLWHLLGNSLSLLSVRAAFANCFRRSELDQVGN